MPQMAPIGWLSLYMLFTMAFMLFCMMNYYSILPTSPKIHKIQKSLMHSLSWKW